jgi:hypothetical protein
MGWKRALREDFVPFFWFYAKSPVGGFSMARANRYIKPRYVYHLTHRCHNRESFCAAGSTESNTALA